MFHEDLKKIIQISKFKIQFTEVETKIGKSIEMSMFYQNSDNNLTN